VAIVQNSIRLQFTSTLTLNEAEIRALDALVGYGDDAFLKAFKEKLGTTYIRNYERGLRSAFEAIRRDILPALRDIDRIRKDLAEAEQRRLSPSLSPEQST
jgi:hypothetical protein